MKPTIIITGCAGMIAWHVIQQLSDYNVVGIDNLSQENQFSSQRLSSLSSLPYFSFINENVIDSKALTSILCSEPIHAIIHLAAFAGVADSFQNPQKIMSNNYCSFLNLLENVRKYARHTPIIYASTSSVYGRDIEGMSQETDILSPLSSYGISKQQNEQIAQLYARQYKLHLIGLRFFTAYGQYNRTDMLVYKIIQSITEQKELTLYHNGLMKRDFLYAGDIAYAMDKILDKDLPAIEHEIFNIAKGSPDNTIDIVSICEEVYGQKANIKLVSDHPSYDPLVTYGDNTKLKSFIGDMPFTSLEDGIHKTAHHFLANKALF